MTSHAIHPDTHTDGLADECDRCAEHAVALISLDDENLALLIERTESWMGLTPSRHDYPRSDNELTAMRWLEKYVLIRDRMAAYAGVTA